MFDDGGHWLRNGQFDGFAWVEDNGRLFLSVDALMPENFDEMRQVVEAYGEYVKPKRNLVDYLRDACNRRSGISIVADALNDSKQGEDVVWFVDDNGYLQATVKPESLTNVDGDGTLASE